MVSVSINHAWTTLLSCIYVVYFDSTDFQLFVFVFVFFSINFRWCKLFWTRQILFCACLGRFFPSHDSPWLMGMCVCVCAYVVYKCVENWFEYRPNRAIVWILCLFFLHAKIPTGTWTNFSCFKPWNLVNKPNKKR